MATPKREECVYVAVRRIARRKALPMSAADELLSALRTLKLFTRSDIRVHLATLDLQQNPGTASATASSAARADKADQKGKSAGQTPPEKKAEAPKAADAPKDDATTPHRAERWANARSALESLVLKQCAPTAPTDELRPVLRELLKDQNPSPTEITQARAAIDRSGSLDDDSSSNSGARKTAVGNVSLTAHLKSMIESSVGSDVTLIVEGKRIPAHKLILVRSEYFRAMLLGKMAEAKQNEVQISGVDAKDFMHVLEYLYTDALPAVVVSPEESLRLFALADRYSLTELGQHCAKQFGETVDIDNVEACLAIAASTPANEPLKLACLDFVQKNYKATLRATSGFEQLAKSHPTVLREIMLHAAGIPLVPRDKDSKREEQYWDPERKGSGVTIVNGNRNRVTFSSAYTDGRHFWTIKVNVLSGSSWLGISDGVGDLNRCMYYHKDSWSVGGHVGHPAFIARDGAHTTPAGLPAYTNGSLVGFLLDMDDRTLSYWVDGKPGGVVFRDLPDTIYIATSNNSSPADYEADFDLPIPDYAL